MEGWCGTIAEGTAGVALSAGSVVAKEFLQELGISPLDADAAIGGKNRSLLTAIDLLRQEVMVMCAKIAISNCQV